jgi:heptosyltransferase-1
VTRWQGDKAKPPEKVLIIKPSAIGDVVHALPVLGLMRRAWPGAKISWLVASSCAGLLEGHPMLEEVIRFERGRFGESWRNPAAAIGLWRFGRELRERKFDLVVDLQGLFRSGWLSGRTKAPVRVGFENARELGWMFYTDRVKVASREVHAVERYLDVAEALGCGRGPVEFVFATDEGDRAWVREKVGSVGRYAVVLPGTNWATKRWPVEHFAGVVKPLRERMGLASVTAGSKDEVALGEAVGATVNLAGKTTLRQLVALIEGAELVIANDSGPMHIAAALGKPLVAMYGPTNPVRTGPWGRMDSVVRLDIACSPCYSRRCSHQSCLRWLTVESVMNAAEKQMAGKSQLFARSP